MPNGYRRGHHFHRGSGRHGGRDQKTVKGEIPRRALPGYMRAYLGDHYEPKKLEKIAEDTPPGHRFLLYFHGMADEFRAEYERGDHSRKKQLNRAKNECDWPKLKQLEARIVTKWKPIKDGRRWALHACARMGRVAASFAEQWEARLAAVAPKDAWQAQLTTIAPFLTGSGNPHPVENGFAFLSPYGIPYLAGSGVKGVLRRVAEELAIEGKGGWTLAHIWALFGFDEKSKWFAKTSSNEDEEEYQRLVSQAAEQAPELLEAWIRQVEDSLPDEAKGRAAETIAEKFFREQSWRRAIKRRGVLCFADTVPVGADLMVDILNPHHREYYLGEKADATPHDAENPVPVFFLAVAPGARMTLRAWPLRDAGAQQLLAHIGDWQALLNALVDRLCEFGGFGAKTHTGYGAVDRTFDVDAKDDAGGEAQTAVNTARNAAESKGAKWVDETVARLAKENNAREEDVLRSRLLAEEWQKVKDEALRAEALTEIRRRWQAKGWWDAPPGKSAKRAKAIYERTSKD